MPYDRLPQVSVIVPVYNGERTIKACIQSLLAQDYPASSLEIIIVDNNSNDRTCDLVQKYPVKLVVENGVQSSYAARNTGIRQARGEIVAFTDADCIADPHWLAELVKPIGDPRIGAVGGKTLDSDPQTDVERFIANLSLFSRHPTDTTFLPMLLTNNAAYRRRLLEQAGCFNQNLYTGADIDLSWRIQKDLDANIAYAPAAMITHVHRSTLKGMAKQLRRHGFGEIFIDAMYHRTPGYQRTPRRQAARMLRQFFALFTYIRSIIFRRLTWKLRGKDRYYVQEPYFWLVAESSNLAGKLSGLRATRFLTINPASSSWQDPGER
jgi:cellulose synthase/poly-beta-1,6-N-acetylglucosamine synthase-like glycosyltransferase